MELGKTTGTTSACLSVIGGGSVDANTPWRRFFERIKVPLVFNLGIWLTLFAVWLNGGHL